MDELEKLLKDIQQLNGIKDYEKVIEILPVSILEKHQNDELYAEIAQAYLMLKNFDLCSDFTDIALSLNFKNPKANYCKGAIFAVNNDNEKAIEYYRRAIEFNFNSSVVYNSLGNIYVRMNSYNEAITVYNKAIEIDSNFASPYSNLGRVYFKTHMYDKSIEFYNKAITIDPQNSNHYNGLGSVYFEQKIYDRAIEFYNKSIEAEVDNSSPYYNLGLIYFLNMDYEKSLQNYERYLELEDSPTSNFFQLAKARIIEIKKFLLNEKYKDISELVNKISELLVFKDECITHYTGLSVAKALILDSSKFRLSEGAFLNDTSEGRELYHYLSISISKKSQDTDSVLFAQRPFIGSFVTETKHDDLTLWRMYGKEEKDEAKGCAITINMESLLKSIKDILTLDSSNTDSTRIDGEYTFYRVAYRKSDQEVKFVIPGAEDKETTLKNYMIELAKKVKKFTPTKAEETYSENKDLIERLNEIAYLFKSVEYQHENEIRLVVDGIEFEKVIDKLLPKVYIELVPIRSLIKKITLGPKIEKAEEWAAAFYYSLEKDGLQPCIHISHLPYK